MTLVKIKKRRQIKRRTLEEADYFFNSTIVENWTVTDFIDYFYAVRAVYLNEPFCPLYHQDNKISMSNVVKLYGKRGVKLLLEGIFSFKEQLFNNDLLREIFQKLSIRTLRSTKMQPLFLQAMQFMQQFIKQQDIPKWKKKPQSQWQEEDWEAWRRDTALACRQISHQGANHGTA